MYPEEMVAPMRKELTDIGFEELKDIPAVDQALTSKDFETCLVVVNSVCGCAAGSARPGVSLAVNQENKPERLFTVFAGVDGEATNHARSYFHGYSPSSPCIALMKDGEVVHMLERLDIEGRSAEEIASDLKGAFFVHCGALKAETEINTILEHFPAYREKLIETIGTDQGQLGASPNGGNLESLLEKIEDILDEEPPLEPVKFSPEGAEKFNEMRIQHGATNAGLVLGERGLDFQDEVADGQLEFESEGMKIFIPKALAKRFSGRTIHFQENEQGGGFAII